MATENSKTIFLGVFLVLVALVCALTAFYYLEARPEMVANEQTESDVAQLPAEKSVDQDSPAQTAKASTNKSTEDISLKNLVDKAETVYGDEEKQRKDGFLWFDRGSSKLVVTLGAVNGLTPGSSLAVYDGNKRIGKVKVDVPFDVISYVQPLDGSADRLTGDYYRVVME
ncbi:MAG: hypothetical protein KC684_05265 [Candidatus Omnitrophica bacterium]|nr:hypothetical protein [Candidatus Omnitrophota bacterium]